MSRARFISALTLALSLMLPAVAAALPRSVQNVFKIFADVLKNQFAIFFFTFLFFFMLFYAIYAALAARLHFFQDGQTHGTNRLGKIFCVSLSLLTCFGIFYFTRGKPIKQVLEDTLGPFAVFGGVVLGLVTFLFVWQGFRHDIGNGWAMVLGLFIAGLALVAVGTALNLPDLFGWGYAIAFLALLIGGLGSAFTHLTGRQPGGAHAGGIAGAQQGAGAQGAGAAGGPGAPPAGPVGPLPGQVGWYGPPQPFNQAALLRWMARPDDEHVTHYQIRWWPQWGALRRHTLDVGLGNEVQGQQGVRAWLVTNLGNHAYNFQIRAFNQHGAGPWSTIAHTTTATAHGDPGGAVPPPPIAGMPIIQEDAQGNPTFVIQTN